MIRTNLAGNCIDIKYNDVWKLIQHRPRCLEPADKCSDCELVNSPNEHSLRIHEADRLINSHHVTKQDPRNLPGQTPSPIFSSSSLKYLDNSI